MNILKWRRIASVFFIGSMLCLVGALLTLDRAGSTGNSLLVLSVLFSGLGLGVSFLFWRCPRCKNRIPMRWSVADEEGICPFCHKKL